MKTTIDSTIQNLNDCGCCEGVSIGTPLKITNRPGLTALAYRVGTYAQFKETLLARLSGSRQQALRSLKTRDNDDFSIALLDAWAVVADVLTFYQERIANESYLRTAIERRSVLELARLIGYELRPGVAASTYLAFTIEDAPGAFGQALITNPTAKKVLESPPPVTIDIGTKVQSVPGPDEQAQTFETIEKIEARSGWNCIKPRLTQPQILKADMGSIILDGTATDLKAGDIVMIQLDTVNNTAKKILKVKVDEDNKTTRIDFDSPGLSPSSLDPPLSPDGKISEIKKVELDGNVVAQIITKTWKGDDISALVKLKNWSAEELEANIAKQNAIRSTDQNTGVFAFRQRAAIFGYNATKQPTYYTYGIPKIPSLWCEWTPTDESVDTMFLDRDYEEVLPNSYIVVQKQDGSTGTFKVNEVATLLHTAYGVSGKTTRIVLDNTWWNPLPDGIDDFDVIRSTSVYVQSEQLALADVPIEDVVKDDTITLDGPYLGLKTKQRVILTGEREDFEGIYTSETRTLKQVILDKGFTVITLDKPLSHSYVRKTVTINANVARSTHGETVEEILGSGDASQSFQQFTLLQRLLTYVSATTPSGAETTLEIRVNDLLWKEVPDFYGHGPQERIYVTLTDDDGKTTVIFGDGKTGTRLPTGQENVRAKYRKGIGLSGLVKANQLSQLMTRSLGLKEVTNPLASDGAADQESLKDARRNAPLTVQTLERIVSLRDYEDFARAFLGIDKALATWSWNSRERSVFVTVAGSKGAIVENGSTLHKNLLTAMRKAGDPFVSLMVESYKPRLFRVKAKIGVKSDYLADKVLPAIEKKLQENFSFGAREFGQPVTISEVAALIQGVPGVKAVDVDKLYRSDEDEEWNPHLEAAVPKPGGDTVFAAELLTLDPRPVDLEVMT
jgi:predicted phage baseplate assembly protein